VQLAYLTSERRDDYRLATLADFDPVRRAFRRYPVPIRLVTALGSAGEVLPPGWEVAAA
jgi:hypothetical protein